MPKAFDECVRRGGRVRTLTKGGNKGRKVCFPKGGGKAKLGYKKHGKKRKR